ncbi:hypothetical protein PO909_008672 [Leuciscus waleckii]
MINFSDDATLVRRVKVCPEPRLNVLYHSVPLASTDEDLNTIYAHLYHMDVLSHLREHQLRSMCMTARYERYDANHVLFYADSISVCWFVLLSGSVLVKEHMYLARCCFGTQRGGRRGCECITLEPSEMIVVENASESDDDALQRHGPQRHSRRRFHKVIAGGERQLIVDAQDASDTLSNTLRTNSSGINCESLMRFTLDISQ